MKKFSPPIVFEIAFSGIKKSARAMMTVNTIKGGTSLMNRFPHRSDSIRVFQVEGVVFEISFLSNTHQTVVPEDFQML